jgi:hypothetical protein
MFLRHTQLHAVSETGQGGRRHVDGRRLPLPFSPTSNGRPLIIVVTVLPDGQTMVNEASLTGVWLPTSQYWPTLYMLQKSRRLLSIEAWPRQQTLMTNCCTVRQQSSVSHSPSPATMQGVERMQPMPTRRLAQTQGRLLVISQLQHPNSSNQARDRQRGNSSRCQQALLPPAHNHSSHSSHSSRQTLVRNHPAVSVCSLPCSIQQRGDIDSPVCHVG